MFVPDGMGNGKLRAGALLEAEVDVELRGKYLMLRALAIDELPEA